MLPLRCGGSITHLVLIFNVQDIGFQPDLDIRGSYTYDSASNHP